MNDLGFERLLDQWILFSLKFNKGEIEFEIEFVIHGLKIPEDLLVLDLWIFFILDESFEIFRHVRVSPEEGIIFPELEYFLQDIKRMYAVIVVPGNAGTVDLGALL